MMNAISISFWRIRSKRYLVLCVFIVQVVFQSFTVIAQTKTSIGTSWGTSSHWSPWGVPTASDDVVINTNMTVPSAGVCLSLTVNSGRTLTISASQSITVGSGGVVNNGTISLTAGTTTTTTFLTIAGNLFNSDVGVLTATGSYTAVYFSGTSTQSFTNNGTVSSPLNTLSVSNSNGLTLLGNNQINIFRVNLFTGTITNANRIILGTGGSSTCVVQVGPNSTSSERGYFDQSPTFDPGTGGIQLLYANASNDYSTSYEIPPGGNNISYLYLITTDKTVSLHTSITITNTFATGLNLASGTLSLGANTLNVEGPIGLGAGTITGGATSNISFIGNIATTLPAVAVGLQNLVISNEAGITLSGAVTVNGSLSLNAGVLSNGSNLTMANGSTIIRSAGSLMNPPAFAGTVNVNYSGSSAITTGHEIPASAGVLNNLTTNTGGVIQGISIVPATNILTDGFTNLTSWTGDIGTGYNQFTAVASANAGGTANEARYIYGSSSTTFYNASIYRFINTSGYAAVNIEWKQFIDNFDATTYPYTVKVQCAAASGGPWTDIYSLSPSGTANIGPQTLLYSNWTTNVGGTFFIRYYIEGYTYGLDYWYFDDLIIDGVEEEPSFCTVNGSLNLTDGTYNIDGNTLVLNGSITGSSAIIGSTASNLTIGGEGSTLQIPLINSGLKDFIINRPNGVELNSDLTIYETLNLLSANPSATQGTLTMGTDTLFMGANAVTIGQGDATGIVKRTNITHDIQYTFGNQFTTVKFPETGTLPSEWAIKTTIGQAPTWKNTAILREYDIVRKGGSGSLPAVRLAYKDGELNGNIENQLVFWAKIADDDPNEYGRVSASTTENWVGLIGSVEFAPTTFGTNLWTLAESESPKYTWTGTVPGQETNWNANLNWVGSEVPDGTSDVLIPAGCTHYPTLPGSTSIKTMTIEEGAIVNGGTGTSLIITGGASAWYNDGTFNPGTSTVMFINSAATLAGETNFYNVTIETGAGLIMTTHSIMRIAGVLTNNGTFHADQFPGTVEYNGGNQDIVNPNGTSPGYHHLILSGSGVKSMPVTSPEVLGIHGNFSIIGTASVTLAGPVEVHENVLIGTDAEFNAGSFTHIVEGNWTNEGGTFTPASSTLVFSGSGLQTITSVSGLETNNLTISNTSASVMLGESTDCSLAGNLTVDTGTIFNLSANRLISVTETITNNGTIRTQNTSASPVPTGRTWGGNFVYAAAISQTAVAGTYNHLTMSGTGGAVANGNITVNGILNLAAVNPSLSHGILEMATTYTPTYSSYTLTMGPDATTIGPGDVTGIVTRNTILADETYTFGNRYTSISFPTVGTLPSSVSLKIRIGEAPAWKTDGILRVYDIIQTGGSGTSATLQAYYHESELNGNPENLLVFFVQFFTPASNLIEYGKGDYNTFQNWVSISDVNIGVFADSFGHREVTLAESQLLALTWNGSVSTSWSTAQNWTPNGAPSDITAVTIPDAATTDFDPELPLTASCKSILIQSGGILNAAEDAVFTVNGADYAWNNQGGTFNAGNSEVIFTNANASMGGSTNFHHLTVHEDAVLILENGTYLGITGAVNNAGPLRPVVRGASTVEYKGNNQTVVVPNSNTNRYSTLILSGSGTKTMPGSALQIVNDFTMAGTASATAGNAITFSGNVTLETGSTFNAASYTHSVFGDWLNNGGTFIPSTSTLVFNGDSLQTIGSASGFSVHNLTISNAIRGVVHGASTDLSLAGNLTVAEGAIFNLAENKLTSIAGALSNAGTIITENSSSTPVPTGLTWGGTFEYAGTDAQTAVAGTFNNFVMSGVGGATASGNITVNGILDLSTGNPTSTKGILDMGSYTLDMGSDATTIGFGDVTGVVRRSSFSAGTPYSFGNQNTTITFSTGGTLPTELSVKTMIGQAPSWKANAIERYNDMAITGGSNMVVDFSFGYLDSELNNNSENDLSVTDYVSSTGNINVLGRSGLNTLDNYVLLNGIDINDLPTCFDERQWALSNQSLTGVSYEGTGTTTSDTYQNVGAAEVSIDVTNVDKVLVTASFTSFSTPFGNTGTAFFRIADQSNPDVINSGVIEHAISGRDLIGSIVYIFDVSAYTGNRTFAFQQMTNPLLTLETTINMTAIALYDGTHQLNCDIKQLNATQTLTENWETAVISTNNILPANSSGKGGFYVSASGYNQKTDGGTVDLATGQWVLQYKKSSESDWKNLSYPILRAPPGQQKGTISLVGIMPENTEPGNYDFRVAHRKIAGTSTFVTHQLNLAVVALSTPDGYFPTFISSKSSISTSSTDFSSVIENYITPKTSTDIFAQAQFLIQTNIETSSPRFDFLVKSGVNDIYDGLDLRKYLMNSEHRCSGSYSGLIQNLNQNETYQMNLRHASASGATLTTVNAYFVGFGLTRSSQSFVLPVTVAATMGVSSSSYPSLKAAFDDINAGVFNGDINIEINDNLTESASCVLNASGAGDANYNSILIYPTSSGLKVDGSIATTLIDLNGADNVTIDGRANLQGEASLTFSNTNTAGSVFRFINDATNNTIRYCNVKGVTTSGTSGLIDFSTGSLVGNDNNAIEYCNISDGISTPTNAIYSAGSSVTADNSNITISNCNIANYFSATGNSAGIFIASNSSAWSITENRFYQTESRTATTGATHWGIRIVTASGVDYIINDNVIGFADAESNGYTTYSGNVAVLYRGIEMTVGLTSFSSVQGNTVAGISLTTSSGLATRPGIFSGISVLTQGSVNIGNITGNTIGSSEGSGSINITSTTSLGMINGIHFSTTSAGNIQNNTIGSISTGGAANIGYTFNGILIGGTGGNFNISSNLIGSTGTANSIAIGTGGVTTAVCTFRGIFNPTSGTNGGSTGIISITGNTIQNCSAFGTGASVFYGILTQAGTGTMDLNENKVIAATNTGTGVFQAILNTIAVTNLNMNSNIVRNLYKTATSGTFTAIANSGAALTSININNNQLGNDDGGLLTYATNNTAALIGISNTAGAAACELSIQNNDIRGIEYAGAAGTNAHTYIINSAATLKQEINNNTFTALNVSTSGAIIFISNSVALPANGVQNVNNNRIVTSFTKNALSGAITLFTSTAATTNADVTVNNNNNNFSNITISGTATIAGWVNTDAGSGNVNKTISGNVFENWTGGTGAITAMNVNITSENNRTKNNSIKNISNAGIIYGIITAAGNDSIYSNTIDQLLSQGGAAATIVSGINVTGGTTKNILNNTISNITGNSLTTGSVRGILVSVGTTVNVRQNTIYGLTANANTIGTVNGVWVTAGGTVSIDRNKIYDISSTSAVMSGAGSVYGIQVSGSTASFNANISNNLIADLRTPVANSSATLRGIGINNTGANSSVNLYYNTIYMNAESSGTNFGTSGVFHTASATATTARLDMRNNIIVNLSTPKGTGTTVAFRRSTGGANTLNNYALSSNNNLFYAGEPGPTRFIYHDFTAGAQTIAAYKAGVYSAGTVAPRDQASVTENPPFLSTDPGHADFLKINPVPVTQIESGAANIATYTVDYAGIIRQGNPGYTGESTSAPDIGAFEGDYEPIDMVPPSISYTPITNNSCISNKILSAVITDGTGVNIVTGTAPRIYFKKSTNANSLPATNDNTTNGWKFTETASTSSPFSFSLNFSLIFGGVTTGDIIQYFIVAQDILEPPYIGINAGTFATMPASVALTAASFPIGGTINSFTILAGLSNTVTIGASGNFTSLTGTGGLFSEINAKGLAGNLVAKIIDATVSETGAVSLNPILYGCYDNYTLTIRPEDGVAANLSGSFDGPLIHLSGADYVIFDGISSGGSSLTISNASTFATASTIRFSNDASNNIVTNCIIEGSPSGIASGIVFFSGGIVTGNDDNTISNNTIRPAGANLPVNAVYSAGTSIAVDNSGNAITGNNIQDYFSPALASNGVFLFSNSSAWNISGNKLFQTAARTSTVAVVHRAVNILTAFGSGYTVSNNIIGYSNATQTGTTTYSGAIGFTYRAIEMTAGAAVASSIQGNSVSGIILSTTSGSTTLPGIFSGISVLAGNVNVGSTTGNTIGAANGTSSISITSTTSLGLITGIYATSPNTVTIQNNNIGSISTGGAATIGYYFRGIHTAGGGQHTIADNTIGSTSTANSVEIGTNGVTTTPVCTFVGISNAATGNITITGNQIINTSVYGTGASVYNGIQSSGVCNTVLIDNNKIIAATISGTGALNAIINSAAASNLHITNNEIRNLVKSATTGLTPVISNTGGVLSVININNNLLGSADGGLITFTSALSSATGSLLTGISNTAGAASCELSIQNNDIRGINYSVASANANTYILNSAATLKQNISNNTFTNLSVNTNGAIIFISNSVVMSTDGVQDVNGNSISGSFTRIPTSGAITLFTSTAATNNTGVTVNHKNNNFSNITVSGAATIAGWVNTDAGSGLATTIIEGNTFSNWSGGTGAITSLNVNITSPNNATRGNQINNISSAGNITGITTGAGNDSIVSNTIHTLTSTGAASIVNGVAITTTGISKNVCGNVIYNLQANNITTGSVSGIAVSGGLSNNLYKNKIYNLSSGSSVLSTGSINGILVSGSVADMATTIYNNRIADLKATAASAVNGVRGIAIINTGLRSSTNIYFNTVFLNATASSGTNFGSSGILHTASANPTTARLDLRNNIIVNISEPKGTGTTVAFQRSAGTANMLNNYAATSNNNLFYAGVPGAANLIYTDGTSSAQTIEEYKAGDFTAGKIAPRDQVSITENPHFLSIDGSHADFMKINSLLVTFTESGAANIEGITSDFEGDIRAGNPGYSAQQNGFGLAPDIGADEFDGFRPRVLVSNAHASSNDIFDHLQGAFAAINDYDQTGRDILVTILETTNEPGTALLNAGAWNSLRVFPSAAGRSIAGNVENTPLIELNGADNVIFDGRVNQTGSTKSLVIRNTASTGAGTSTIKLNNSSENNVFRYCIISGSSQSQTDGVITFATASTENGNSSNIIEFSDIRGEAGNRPVNAVYSAGSTGFENKTNIIRNSNIFDFLSPEASSRAIHLSTNNTDWTITTNSFYETTTLEPVSGTFSYGAIRIDSPDGNNFTITNNCIGGRGVNCSGSPFTVSSNENHSFTAIYLNVGSITSTLVQNNNIRNWDYSTASATPWRAIEVAAGNVNIGTATGNTIGATSGNGSIEITSSVNAQSYAVYVGSSGTVNVSRNSIGSINIYGNDTGAAHSFTAIYKANTGGAITINNNTIGSSLTTNSIYAGSQAATSTAGQHLRAIHLESSGTANITINTISHLSNAYSGSNTSYTRGIHATAGSSSITRNTIRYLESAAQGSNYGSVIALELNGTDGANTLTDNGINFMSSTGSTFEGFIAGIWFSGNTGANLVTRNLIRNLSVHSGTTAATMYGIRIASGATTYSNNIVSLGGNTATTLYGIFETGTASNNNNLYFNTVYIGGSLGTGITNKSYAFYSDAANNVRNFRNNIFSNFRSTTGGSSLHYAVYFNYGTSANLTLDYNNYYAPGTGGVAGYYNGTDQTVIPLVPSNDANSTIADPQFVNAGGSTADDYKLAAAINGILGTGIVLDYGQTARGDPPNVGAWEFNTNRWMGNVSTNFADADNWTSGAVPLEGVSVVFAVAPDRDCVLDQDRVVANIINNQGDKKFVINGHQLTITGGLLFTNGGQIDAGTATSTLVFAGEEEAQVIPDGAFVNNVIPNLVINNEFGVVSQSDLTINEILNLQSANPSATAGCLHTGTKVITLGANAVTVGDGDVSGIVKRTSIVADKTYTFGNKNAKIFFPNIGTLPTEISVKMTLGAAPTWQSGAVERIYDIIQTGANPLDPTMATIFSTYLDSELNGNDEDKLVNWSYRYINSQLFEHGRASYNSDENWIKLTNINMAFFPSSFGMLEIGIDEGVLETLTWNGSVSTSWTTVNNWTPMGAPSDYVNIIIPDASTTPNDPILPPETTIKTLKLETGAILNSIANAQATIIGGEGAWENEGGTFNPGTSSNVTFESDQATIAGSTDFYNVTIDYGAILWMKNASAMRISGSVSNNGTWRPVILGSTTVEYNGGNQVVVVPNPASNRYSTLILSGSGTKTMPSSTLSMMGDFILAGTVNVTALNNLVVVGSFSIGADASFNSGSKNHSIGGHFTHHGSFSSTGSTITFNGFTPQAISGSAFSTVFENLTILNDQGVTSSKDLTVNGNLDLQSENPSDLKGCLDMGIRTLKLGATTLTTGPGDVTGIVKRVHSFESDQTYTFGNRFTSVTFRGCGTKPTEISIKTTIGNAPGWKTSAIKRYFDFAQTGGNNCFVDVSVNYLESELNNAVEDELVYWGAFGFPTPQTVEWGRSEIDTTDRWLLLRGVPIALWPSGIGQMEITLAETEHPILTWNGSQSTNWENAYNWTPVGFPTKFTRLIIPNASTTDYDPILPLLAMADEFLIETDGVLNASAYCEFQLFNHNGGFAWENHGAFNALNSTVVFIKDGGNVAGETNFYNVTVMPDVELTPQAGCVMRIAGELVNDGIFNATRYNNTFEYNGSTQTVIMPNGVTPGYHSLILSGTDVKTMPDEVMNIYGNFSLAGTANVTALDNLNISGSLSVGSNATFNTGGHYLTLGGDIAHNGVFNASLSTVELVGTSSQTINGSASSTIFRDLLIHQVYGAVSNKDITVNRELCLHNTNPGATTPVLNMTSYILDLGPLAYVIGNGDATGIVRRTSIERNRTYAFGNKNASISFNDAGTIPTEMSVRISIGTAPAWRTGSIQRVYEIIQTGADAGNPTQATIRSTYLDSELNGNTEEKLVNWSYRNPPGMHLEHGRSDYNSTENWLELTNINMAFFPSTFGTLYITMDESEIENLTWNGSVSSSWTTVDNWTPNGAPSSFVNVAIPDASTTPNDPYLNYVSEVKTLTIEEGGILNSTNGSVFNIYGGDGAWSNLGTFNPGNTTVIFNHAGATIAGETNFQSLTIDAGASLTPLSGNIMRIGGALSNSGTLHAAANNNTIEYSGAVQTVILPNGTTPGYHSLALSGSGTKALPSAAFNIYGDFSLAGTAQATAQNNLTIGGSLSVGATASFTTGAFSHSVGGDFINDGSFTASTGNTIVMNGSSAQIISGTASPAFHNLTISSTGGVTGVLDVTANNVLNLQSNNPSATLGSLHMGAHTLHMGATATTTGAGDVTGIVKRTTFLANTSYTFGNQFTTIALSSGGTLPSEIKMYIEIGTAPYWKPEAITRQYDIARTGGSSLTATLKLHYLDSELNNCAEADLKIWNFNTGTSFFDEIGQDDQSTNENWVNITNLDINDIPLNFNDHLWSLYSAVSVVIEDVKGWRMIASPTASTYSDLLDGFVSQGMTGSTYPARQPNLLWFNETEGLTTNMSWRTPAAITDNIKPGRGYYFYVFGDIPDENDYNDVLPKQMSTSGLPNFSSGSFSYSGLNHAVTYTSRADNQTAPGTYYDKNIADEGWNMIGNPSTRTLNWDHSGWTKTNIDNSIYLWDPKGNEWKTWNGFTGNMGNGLVSPFQAFWVRANDPAPELNFTDEVLTSGGYFYGGGPAAKSQSAETDPINVKITLSAGDQKTTVFITFTKDAVVGPDKSDAYRLEPLSDTWLELFTLSSTAHTMPMAINALPSEGPESFNLPLFVGGQNKGNSLSGDFKLSWELPSNWPSDWSISLHDHNLQKATSMMAGDNYSFGYSVTKQAGIAGLSGDSLFSLPGDLLRPVSLQSTLKSSSQLSPFSIIIEKGANNTDPAYVSKTPKLLPNYPNPFRESTTIRFSLPETQAISLDLYDISGRYIETIEHRSFEPGVHEIQWQNNGLNGGIYLLYLRTASTNDVIKLNLLK